MWHLHVMIESMFTYVVRDVFVVSSCDLYNTVGATILICDIYQDIYQSRINGNLINKVIYILSINHTLIHCYKDIFPMKYILTMDNVTGNARGDVRSFCSFTRIHIFTQCTFWVP